MDIPVCTTVDQIHSFEHKFYLITELWVQSEILRDTGCYQPCQFTEYKLAIDPLREKGANLSMTLLLSNPDITSKKEEILFDFQCFVAEFGGALGLFLGFSFVMVWDGLQTLGTSVWRSSGRCSGVAVRAVDCWQ